jgi:hypothetical protein
VTAHFAVSAERTDEMVIISCSGELDIATAPELEEAIGEAVSPDAPKLIRLDWSVGLNLYQSGPIYADILRYKKYPEGLFSGSPETLDKLRQAIASAPGGDAQ